MMIPFVCVDLVSKAGGVGVSVLLEMEDFLLLLMTCSSLSFSSCAFFSRSSSVNLIMASRNGFSRSMSGDVSPPSDELTRLLIPPVSSRNMDCTFLLEAKDLSRFLLTTSSDDDVDFSLLFTIPSSSCFSVAVVVFFSSSSLPFFAELLFVVGGGLSHTELEHEEGGDELRKKDQISFQIEVLFNKA